MSARLDHAVGLLERSLAGTCEVLGRVRPDDLRRPTPCDGWDLAALLAHMDDSVGVYLEASRGHLRLAQAPRPAYAGPVGSLRARARSLLGAWSAAAERDLADVGLDPAPGGLPADLLVSVAALEVAVHGWDVARSLGDPVDPGGLAPGLAAALLPVARCTAGAGRVDGLFAPPLRPGPRDDALAALLGELGRSTDRADRGLTGGGPRADRG